MHTKRFLQPAQRPLFLQPLQAELAGVIGYQHESTKARNQIIATAPQHSDHLPVVTLKHLGKHACGTQHFEIMTDSACIYVFRPRNKPPHPVGNTHS